MRCQFCGVEIPDDSAFCPECGKMQEKSTEQRDTREMPGFCEYCGARLEPGAAFCAVCGKRTAGPESEGRETYQEMQYGQNPYADGYEGELFGDDPDEKGKKSKAPLIIAIIAIVAVLTAGIGIAVKIFIFDKDQDKRGGKDEGKTVILQDGEDREDDEEQPDVDFNLTEEGYQTLSGEIKGAASGDKRLALDNDISVYGRDEESGEEVVLERLDSVLIDPTLLPEGMLDDSLAENVSMSGELIIRDGELQICPDTVESRGGEDLIAAYEENYAAEEGGIHRYELIVKDCTWEEAFRECRDKGGYLVRINSREEMEYIIDQISGKGLDGTNFFLGGRRDADSREYYWVDENNQCYGEKLNDVGYSCYDYWMTGEPTFQDGDIQECYMNMFYYEEEGRTVINDVPNDVIAVVPYYSGKVGYICEYED